MNKYILPYLTTKEKQQLLRVLKTLGLFTVVVVGALLFNWAIDWMWSLHYGRLIVLLVFGYVLYQIFKMIYKSDIVKSKEEREDDD